MLEHEEITREIIGAAFEVYKHLGYGFLENVYKKAMQVELEIRGIPCILESKLVVKFKNHVVGDYSADLFVAECVIVELKIAKTYCPADEAQLLNELKATGIKVGLLINFGKEKVEFRRFVY